MKNILLFAGMALATGLGISMAPSASALPLCERICREDYTHCWYSCTPGQSWCYAMCADNYNACSADCAN